MADMNSNTPLLSMSNIYKSFGEVEVLSDVNFEVGRNEIIGLVGYGPRKIHRVVDQPIDPVVQHQLPSVQIVACNPGDLDEFTIVTQRFNNLVTYTRHRMHIDHDVG